MRNFSATVFLFILQFFSLADSFGQAKEEVLVLSDSQKSYVTGFHSFILQDEKNIFTEKDIMSGRHDSEFYRYEKGKFVNLGFSLSVYWLRLRVKNGERYPKEWDFVMSYPHFDFFEFYYEENGHQKKFVSGDVFPFSQRLVVHRNFVIPVNFEAGEEKTIYVKMQSNGSFQFPLEAMQRNYFLEQISYEDTAFGFFYGVMLTMILYNLFLFFSFRDPNYLYYILSIFFAAMFVAASNGHAFQFFWSDSPHLNNNLTASFMGGWIVFTTIFTKNFLALNQQRTKLLYLMYLLTGIGIFTMFANFIAGYAFSVRNGAASVGLTAFSIIIVSVWAFFKKIKAARFFLLAWLLFLLGVLMIVLVRFGLFPYNFFTNRGVEMGAVLQVLLLSFALGDKFKLILAENQLMQRKAFEIEKAAKENLEEKVKERTQSLQEAIEEINQTNEELTTTLEIVQNQKIEIEKKNTDLTAGITYAKRIQQAFLPSQRSIKQQIPELFIFFKPRDIVSGDFYWYKDTGRGASFFAIADCTGHGVPGALMSMIGVNLLSEIISIHGVDSPKEVLRALHLGVIAALHQQESQNRDGMVISLFKIDFANRMVVFSGAKHGLLMVKTEEDWQYVKGDRISVGDIADKKEGEVEFTEHTFSADAESKFYSYSDGFPDQFGGSDNKKFKYDRLNKLLAQNAHLPFEEQAQELDRTLKDWLYLGKQQQIDDILVAGFKL